jgi:hypothetical protein
MKKTFADIATMSPMELKSFVSGLDKKYQSEKSNLRNAENAMATEMPTLMGGNLNDVNKIIWPFFFTSSELTEEALIIAPNVTQSAYINITQEAGFVVTEIIKSVFKYTDLGGGKVNLEFIDPKDSSNAGIASGLDFSLIDSSSSRTFHYKPMSVDHVGDARNAWNLDTPIYFANNSNIEVKFSNNNSVDTFVPFFVFKGYRIRVEDSREILSQVVG